MMSDCGHEFECVVLHDGEGRQSGADEGGEVMDELSDTFMPGVHIRNVTGRTAHQVALAWIGC